MGFGLFDGINYALRRVGIRLALFLILTNKVFHLIQNIMIVLLLLIFYLTISYSVICTVFTISFVFLAIFITFYRFIMYCLLLMLYLSY